MYTMYFLMDQVFVEIKYIISYFWVDFIRDHSWLYKQSYVISCQSQRARDVESGLSTWVHVVKFHTNYTLQPYELPVAIH